MPTSKSRKRRARGPRRRPASRPREPEARFRGLLRSAIASARDLLEARHQIDVEMWISGLLADWYGAEDPSPEDLARMVVPGGLIEAAEHDRTERGLALLLALAATAPPEIAGPAGEGAARLSATGLTTPAWAEELGRPALIGAWLGEDPFGDADILLLAYRYAGSPEHAFSILIDRNLGEVVKDVAVLAYKPDFIEDVRRDPEVTLRDLTAAEAARRLRAALVDADWLGDLHSEETRALMPLIEARLRSLPATEPADEAPVPDDEERERLVADYLAAGTAGDLGDAGAFAGLFIDYKCDQVDGDPLRWSPILVETFFNDYVPRKISGPEDKIRAIPIHLRPWLTFTARRRGLPEHLLDQMLAALEDFSREFERSFGDLCRYGTSKRLVMAMEEEGVDVTDQRAVDGWIEEFNTRPFAERGRILGLDRPTE